MHDFKQNKTKQTNPKNKNKKNDMRISSARRSHNKLWPPDQHFGVLANTLITLRLFIMQLKLS